MIPKPKGMADPQKEISYEWESCCCMQRAFQVRTVTYPERKSALDLNMVEDLTTSEQPYFEEYLDKKYRDVSCEKLGPRERSLQVAIRMIEMELALLPSEYTRAQRSLHRQSRWVLSHRALPASLLCSTELSILVPDKGKL